MQCLTDILKALLYLLHNILIIADIKQSISEFLRTHLTQQSTCSLLLNCLNLLVPIDCGIESCDGNETHSNLDVIVLFER